MNGENIDAAAFNDNVGGFLTLTNAADAQVTVGSGAGFVHRDVEHEHRQRAPARASRSTSCSRAPSPVTVTVTRDDASIADKVQALVDAANVVQSTVDGLTKYDPTAEPGLAAHRRLDREPAHERARRTR